MNGTIIDEMKKCKEERCIVELYNDYGSDDDFVNAVILDVNDKFYTYAYIINTGEFNGIRLDFTDTVFRICRKSRHLDMVNELVKIFKRKLVPDKYKSLYPADITRFLITAMELDMPVSVYFAGSGGYSVTGYVISVGDRIFELEVVNTENGIILGTDTASKDSISYIKCGDCKGECFCELKKSGFLM